MIKIDFHTFIVERSWFGWMYVYVTAGYSGGFGYWKLRKSKTHWGVKRMNDF